MTSRDVIGLFRLEIVDSTKRSIVEETIYESDVPKIPGWAAIADLDLVECAIPAGGAMS